jgi:hypothetical protein
LAFRDFGVELPIPGQQVSARIFYRDMLHKYRRLLGLWARRNLNHYGSLLRVSARGGTIVFEELLPPPPGCFYDPLRSVLFLTFTWGRRDAQLKIQSHQPPYVCEKVNLGLAFEDGEQDPVLKLRLSNFADQRSWARPEIPVMIPPACVEADPHRLRSMAIYSARSQLSYTRLRVESSLTPSGAVRNRLPLSPGIFKGTYGVHGIQLIHLVIPTGSSLLNATGTKITGDPNIPCGDVSFVVKSGRCLAMDMATQRSVEKIKRFMAEPCYEVNYEEDELYDFEAPVECRLSEPVEYVRCKGRWSCECRVATKPDLLPRTIPGNFILFTEDVFAVLFLELNSLILFHRARLM